MSNLRPSEMLVSFLEQIANAGYSALYYCDELVEEIEQVDYDKFVILMLQVSDEEIYCDEGAANFRVFGYCQGF